MNKLLNTFRYGSWKTRLFFGTIALAFLGGAATIAVAAVAGLGIIPVAVGGAAIVLGIGMSTMVTVVSDEKPENPDNPDRVKNIDEGPAGDEKPQDAEKAGSVSEDSTGEERLKNTEKANTAREEDTIIHYDGDGTYIPDEIKEDVPAKMSYKADVPDTISDRAAAREELRKSAVSKLTMKPVREKNIAPSSGPYIEGLPPDVPEQPAEKTKEAAPATKKTEAAPAAKNKTGEAVSKAEVTPAARKAETAPAAKSKTGEAVSKAEVTPAAKKAETAPAAKNKTGEAVSKAEVTPAARKNETVPETGKTGERGSNVKTTSPQKKPGEAARKAETEPAAKKTEAAPAVKKTETAPATKQAETVPAVKKTEAVSAARKTEVVQTEESGGKAETAPAPKQTEAIHVTRKTQEAENSSETVPAARKEGEAGKTSSDLKTGQENDTETDQVQKASFAKRFLTFILGGPEKKAERERRKLEKKAKKEADRHHIEDGVKTRQERKDIKRRVKEKTKDYGRELEEKFENQKSFTEKEKQREDEYAAKVKERAEAEPAPVERLPGEEIDVSKYTASNMKKIIKSKKLGKDFIPVFIENWNKQNVEKTPALCYLKDEKIHLLLLEGDIERDVVVPTDKFINVWYQKNVPVTNVRVYKDIEENMGAIEMFEDVMPAFAHSSDKLGGTNYTQNLYLLGNEIALAPPSMRELRKRFRFNTNIFDSLNTRGNYSDYFKKAYENRILWTDNVIGLQEYQRRIRAILQEMVNDDNLLKFEFEEDVAKMVQYRLITDEYADFYLNLRQKQ